MDHEMFDFGNNNYKTEEKNKVSLLEKENFELRDQLIHKLLIIKQLETSYPKKVTYSLLMLLQQIWSLHQPKLMITSTVIMALITAAAITTKKSTTITAKTMKTKTTLKKITRSEILKRTIIALMKKQFITKR